MSLKKDKSTVDLKSDFESLKITVEDYIKAITDDEEVKYTASLFLNWLNTKTKIITNEKKFVKPDNFELKRGKVVWVDFGFNIGAEFGGRHPAVILRVSGEKVFVMPLSSQKPNDPDDNKFVKVEKVYEFKPMKRWINVLNMTSISIQRIDYSSNVGRVNGTVLDDISKALRKVGIK